MPLSAAVFSIQRGENTSIKSLPTTSAEKIDTINGHINRRRDSQKRDRNRSMETGPVLSMRAKPTIMPMPRDISQRRTSIRK